jgi:hypothetical protein
MSVAIGQLGVHDASVIGDFGGELTATGGPYPHADHTVSTAAGDGVRLRQGGDKAALRDCAVVSPYPFGPTAG